jgi:hypothetical protein
MVVGVTKRPRRRAGSSWARAAISARSGQFVRGVGCVVGGTARWWGRTRISISFEVSDRVSRTSQPRVLVDIR